MDFLLHQLKGLKSAPAFTGLLLILLVKDTLCVRSEKITRGVQRSLQSMKKVLGTARLTGCK